MIQHEYCLSCGQRLDADCDCHIKDDGCRCPACQSPDTTWSGGDWVVQVKAGCLAVRVDYFRCLSCTHVWSVSE